MFWSEAEEDQGKSPANHRATPTGSSGESEKSPAKHRVKSWLEEQLGEDHQRGYGNCGDFMVVPAAFPIVTAVFTWQRLQRRSL
jgi:hypothetical protein